MSAQPAPDLLNITAEIVASHVANNQVEASALPSLIQTVYRTVSSIGMPDPAPTAAQPPAVPVKKSVFSNFIVCLEDGRRLKTLKRHLHTAHGMTLDEYRAKWRLPNDYPMTAPNYAIKRSDLAKKIGLGLKAVLDSTQNAEVVEPAVTQLPMRRARGSKG